MGRGMGRAWLTLPILGGLRQTCSQAREDTRALVAEDVWNWFNVRNLFTLKTLMVALCVVLVNT